MFSDRFPRMAAGVGLLLAAAAPASAADNRPEVSRTIEASVAMGSATAVLIEHESGNVTIRTHAEAELRVVATVRASAKSRQTAETFVQAVTLLVGDSAGTMTVRMRRPPWTRQNSDVGFVIDLDIVMPADRSLTARHRFGNLSASGLRRGAMLINRQGRIVATDITGDSHFANEFSAIEARNVTGDVTITNRFGTITVEQLRGNLVVNGSPQAVHVSGTTSLDIK